MRYSVVYLCKKKTVGTAMMYKCPTCGKKTHEKDYSSTASQIRDAMDQRTVKSIDDIFTYFDKVQGESYKSIFFNEIKDIQNIIIRRGIEMFKSKKLYEAGYGIKYLLGVIKGEEKTFESRKEYEKKYLDRLPPVRSK